MKQKNKKYTETTTGVIKTHPRGFGFVQPEERDRYPEDIFIPRHAINGAVDGDTVETTVNPSAKGPEGAIVKVLKRGRLHVAGTITHTTKKGAFAYVPLLGEEKLMRIRPHEEKEFQVGDRIIIHVLNWGNAKKEPFGAMQGYIGHISNPACDTQAAVEEFELKDAFPKKVIEEAQSFGEHVSPEDIEKREDLREIECFTIDPETAKDFDDALSLEQDEKGNFHLGVHIADVSHYVSPKSHLDREARDRCNSIYFPGTVLPMLPHELSSHLCSLKPNVNRLTISVFMTFDKEGVLKNYRIARTVIRSKKRFSYKEAKETLDGKRKSKFTNTLFLMVDLCHRLKRQRTGRGSIEFSLPDVSIQTTPDGVPKKIEIVEYDITHQLVEEFMLKANEVVATHLSKQGKPLTYRIHESPNPDNMREFAALAQALGFTVSSEPSAAELQQLFDEARSTPFGQFLATAFIRSLKLASYSTQNIGHYGLGLENYTHFTSPIRRYIDLIVHRLLFSPAPPHENLEKVAEECSLKERLGSKAENAVVLLKKLRFLSAELARDPQRKYAAVITRVKPFGFAFELPEFLYEGFLPLAQLGHAYFTFNEKNRALESKKQNFQTGDRITVQLIDVNLVTQETDWKLADKAP